MKKRTVRLLSAFLAATMVLGCAACGKSNSSESGDSNGDKKTIVFWSIGLKLIDESGQKEPEELGANIKIKEFEEAHPGVTVEVIDQPTDSIDDLFKAANVSEEGPDVVGLWSGNATNNYKDYLLPLNEYMTDDEIAQYTGLDLCREDFKVDGDIKALPYNLTTYNIFYNKEYFKQADISEEELPTTWDEFLEVCKKLKEAGVQPLIMGDSSGESTTWMTSEFMVDLTGPEGIVDFGNGTLAIDCGEYKQSLETWTGLFGKGYTNDDYDSLAAWDSIQRFVTGEGAMNINGSWAIGEMEPIMGENLGTFKIPAITKDAEYGDYIVSQPGANVSVTTYAKEKDIAVEFVKFMTSADAEAAYHADNGDIPANNQVDISVISNPISQEAYSWIKENKAGIGYDSLLPLNVTNELYKLGPTLCRGDITVDEFIKKLEAQK